MVKRKRNPFMAKSYKKLNQELAIYEPKELDEYEYTYEYKYTYKYTYEYTYKYTYEYHSALDQKHGPRIAPKKE